MIAKKLLSTLFTGAFSLCLIMQAHAQNPNLQITDPKNASLDYMPGSNSYLLSGNVSPATVGPYSNTVGFGNLGRIQLQVVDNNFNTTLNKTYCTILEVNDIVSGRCTNLSVNFLQSDAKQTSDGGFILCGYVAHLAEFTTCPGNGDYSSLYLLKTNNAGMVQWYKRYNTPGTNLFPNSVAEDPATHNIVVCGSVNYVSGFMIGVDPLGNLLWVKKNQSFSYLYGTPVNSNYKEITPYTDPNTGQQFLVLTGSAGVDYFMGFGSSFQGGSLITTIDGLGTVYNNVYLTEDYSNHFQQALGVSDAHDGDVVLSGYSGMNACSSTHGFDLMIEKVNPLNNAISFSNSYAYTPLGGYYNRSFGYSITTNSATGPGGRISATGVDGNGVYIETDFSGNCTPSSGTGRYVQYTPGLVGAGVAIVHNSTNNYVVHSGTSGTNTSLVKNKYGFDCIPDQDPLVVALYPYVVQNTESYMQIIVTPERMLAFNMNYLQGQVCGGAPKPGAPAVNASLPEVTNITLSPNPAEAYLDVQLPGIIGNSIINVYDMTGKVVLSQKADAANGPVRFDVKNLANGAYIVAAENNGNKQHATFVKQ